MTSAASYSNLVQELYLTYFGRPADAQGLQNFEAAMATAGAPTNVADLSAAYGSSTAIKSLIDSFGTSPESSLLYGQVTTSASSATAFVNAVFENLLNRAPAASGLNFWVTAITSGTVSLGNAALSIAAGAMTNTSAQGLIDAATINNKLDVASQFTASVSDRAGIADYVGPAAALQARSLLANVDSNTDIVAYQATVQLATNNLELGTSEATTALTTANTDVVVSGNITSTINASLNNTAGLAAGTPAATLNPGDSITGNGKFTTLNVNDFGLGSTISIPAATITGITTLNLQSAEAAGTLDFTAWAGLKSVDIGLSHGAANVTAGATTALSLSDSGAAGAVTTHGGSSVSIFSDTGRSVTVNGGSATTSVAISGGNSATVLDAGFAAATANSITSVSLSNVAGTGTIESNALGALSVSGDTGFAITTSATVSLTPLLTLTLDNDKNVTFSTATCLALHVDDTTAASSGITLTAPKAGALAFNDSANLALTSLTAPNAITVTISGAGNLSADMSNVNSIALINATAASGVTTLALHGNQSFSGGAGQDIISINSLNGAVTGGTAGNNSIDFIDVTIDKTTNLAAYTNFATWETSGSTSGLFDMTKVKSYNNLIVNGAGGDIAFDSIKADTPISLPGSDAHTITLDFVAPESSAPSTLQLVNLGTTTSKGVSVNDLLISGYAGQGAAVLDIVSDSATGQINQIDNLVDSGLKTLNISGNAAVSIGDTLTVTPATFTIQDTAATGVTTIGGLADAALSTLNIQSYGLTLGSISSSAASFTLGGNGAGAITIGSIADAQLTTAQISETSTSINTTNTITIGSSTLPALQSLTLNGYVAIKVNGVTDSSGFNLAAANDNAAVSFTSSGLTSAGDTDVVKLGNGNDQVTLGQGQLGSTQNITLGDGADSVTSASVGTLNITLGSGNNSITSTGNNTLVNISAGNGNNTVTIGGSYNTLAVALGSGSNNVTLGSDQSGSLVLAAHTGSDNVGVGAIGGLTSLDNIALITGLANAGSDTITLADTASSSSAFVQITAAEVTASGGTTATLASWVAAALGKGHVVPQVAHDVEWFQFGGNTYLIETSGANDAGRFFVSDSAIELAGTGYTFAHSTFTGNVIHLLG